MLRSASPIMPSRDLDQTVAFYLKIGFELVGRWDDHGYLIFQKDAAELHFFRHPEHVPETCDHGVYVRLSDVDEWSRSLAALELPDKGFPRFAPAEDKGWGMRELTLLDPDGNLLRAGRVADNG